MARGARILTLDIYRHGPAVAVLGVASLALAGCAVGPNFRRPVTPTPPQVTAAPLPPAAPEGQVFVAGDDVAADWWRVFHSEKFDGLIAQALRDNPSLAAAQDTMLQARETMLAARGGLLPSVSGQLGHSRQELSGAQSGLPGVSQTFSYVDAQLNVSYTFDIWGATRRGVEAQAAQAEYEKFQAEGAANMLAANTATAVINAASLSAQIVVEKSLLRAQQDELKTVRSQFELGGATGSDVATQEALAAQTAAQIPPLLTQLAQSRDLLAAYLGRVPAEAVLPEISLDDLRLPRHLPASLPSQLVDQRPDIRASEAQLHQASAQLGIAIAARLPQLTLTGNIGSAPARAASLFTPGNGTWTLANQLLAPIFQGGTLLHQQRAAAEALKAAAETYQNTVVTAFQNVADVMVALSNDGAALDANQAAERAARRSLSLAQDQYRAGGIAYLSVLNAQTQYQTAVLGVIRARAAQYSDSVALYAALGGGWWNKPASIGSK